MSGLTVLLKKNLRSIANFRRASQGQSVFKVAVITFFAIVFLLTLGLCFYGGFEFLYSLGGIGMLIINRLFAFFFFGLAIMLVLSGAIGAYTTIYRSDEMPFLLLRPLPLGQIMLYKYIETAFLASWAFFFIIIPFVGAYAWHENLPIWFSLWTIIFSIPFVFLCAGFGVLICLVFVRWIPTGRRLWVPVGICVVAVALYMWQSLGGDLAKEDATLILSRVIPGIQLASHPLLPNLWVAEGIMALTRGQWMRGAMFLSLLITNLLVLAMVIEGVGRKLFYPGWQRILGSSSSTNRKDVMLRPVERLLGFVAADMRGMMVKDIRIFFRDASQWLQSVIFFGLLAIYFFNLRNFSYHTLSETWRNVITFLNVFSVSAVMCSFGSRFIYPQLSLEGQGFWIVGMSPSTMGRVLMAKFFLALISLFTISVGLMYVSASMLSVSTDLMLSALIVAGAMSFAVSGLATGLGAMFMDLKQRNPAAIVSSFGGTLNLVLSILFMFAIILPFAFSFHMFYEGHFTFDVLLRARVACILWLIVLTCITTCWPLLAGRRCLTNREY